MHTYYTRYKYTGYIPRIYSYSSYEKQQEVVTHPVVVGVALDLGRRDLLRSHGHIPVRRRLTGEARPRTTMAEQTRGVKSHNVGAE